LRNRTRFLPLKRLFKPIARPNVAALLVVASLVMGPRWLTITNHLVWSGAAPRAETLPVNDTLSHILYLPLVRNVSSQLLWGALVDGLPPTTAALQPGGAFDTFETRAGKKMAILHWGQPWRMNGADQPFQTSYFNNVRNRGSIPLLDWGSWVTSAGPIQPDFQLNKIYGGQYDGYIQQWAAEAKAWGHPFFLRFDWEMNGTWQFPWSEQLNANQPGDYIKAWRHVHDIFTATGATNVTWVWCPNISGATTRPYAGLLPGQPGLYPGDAYVDWTCFDGYNKYGTWLGFNTVFTGSGINWLYDSYQQLLSVAPSKPIMIGETGSLEAGDGGAQKAAWITDGFSTELSKNLPQIRAVVWFNWDSNNPLYATLPIESSPASIAAFATAIRSNIFLGNEFSGLNTSPIRPPN